MKTIILLLMILGFTFTAHAKTDGRTFETFYVKNYDADTITLKIVLFNFPYIEIIRQMRIRGIDTPEIGWRGKCQHEKDIAITARNMVENLLKGAEKIEITNLGTEKYGRLLANVIVDGQNISHFLLQDGLAVLYDGGKKTHDWCEEKE